MSKQILLYPRILKVIIVHTSKGIQGTQILFSIHDHKKIAYYKYTEESIQDPSFMNAYDQDLENNKKLKYSIFSERSDVAWGFSPKAALGVDAFANGNQDNMEVALARFSSRRAKEKIFITMNVFLKSGPELLVFGPVKSENTVDFPASYEWGRVYFYKVEKYSTGASLSVPIMIQDYFVFGLRKLRTK